MGGVAPHFDVLSLRMMLFLVPTFFLVLSICALYDKLSVHCDAKIHREVAIG